jgi:hypothetical protein
MKLERYDDKDERLILTGMIVNDTICGHICAHWRDDLFRSKWANLVSKWCSHYNAKYGKAPREHIQNQFNRWARKSQDEAIINIIDSFLTYLSDKYEETNGELNPNYVLDQAGDYFNHVKLKNLMDELENDLSYGHTTEALDRVIKYDRINMGQGSHVEMLTDDEAIRSALATELTESLVYFPPGKDGKQTPIAKFFAGQLVRDSLVMLMGPEKRGKSWWLIDLAYRALWNRKRVAYFEAGDMSQTQVLRRFMIRITGLPASPKRVRIPVRLYKRQDDTVSIKMKGKTFRRGVDWTAARRACDKLMKRKAMNQSYFRLQCHPNSTLHVKDIESSLTEWARDGWVPDVIVIDYADILNMDYKGLEGRDSINQTWKDLRRLSQELHCLVITASQADAASYDAMVIRNRHFSEDKRKLAHITGGVGLNATDDEKKRGIMRLNWFVLREAPFIASKCIYTAGCLDIGNPMMISC